MTLAEVAPSDDFGIEKAEDPLAGISPAARPESVELESPLPETPSVMDEVAPAPGSAAPSSAETEKISEEPASLEGLEPMEFTPPAGAEGPPPVPDSGAPPLPGAVPFDDQLAWGTGERQSGQISPADLEAAERAHDAAIDTPAPAAWLEGLGGSAAPAEERARLSADLPLFYPEDDAARAGEPGREAETPAVSEPEPVVTETMAELYAKQGLLTEARAIYRKLVAQRPGEPGLSARLAELESGAMPSPRPSAGRRLSAVETGGPSVRDFLTGLFGGTAAAAAAAAAPATPAAPAEAMAAAPPGQPPGEPTRRASDEVSLASVFGEEPPPVQRSEAAPSPAKAGDQSFSFSFDEFFGAQGKTPAAGQAPGGKESPAEGEDDFKRWLKGLKS
jgi:hypothetical protein